MLLTGLHSDCSEFLKPTQLTPLYTEEHTNNVFKYNTFCLQMYLFRNQLTWFSILPAAFRVQYFPALSEHKPFPELACCRGALCQEKASAPAARVRRGSSDCSQCQKCRDLSAAYLLLQRFKEIWNKHRLSQPISVALRECDAPICFSVPNRECCSL